MERVIMSSILASLVALTNAHLENVKPLTLNIPQLQFPQLQNLPTLSSLQVPGLQLPNLISNNPGNDIGNPEAPQKIPCTCGVFLSGQFKKGQQPVGNVALLQELSESLQCGPSGDKLCINKCLDTMVRHLPNSGPMICGSIDRDCHKERAYLFIKNCKDVWINSNLSAGREYCCKDGFPYKCPSNYS